MILVDLQMCLAMYDVVIYSPGLQDVPYHGSTLCSLDVKLLL